MKKYKCPHCGKIEDFDQHTLEHCNVTTCVKCNEIYSFGKWKIAEEVKDSCDIPPGPWNSLYGCNYINDASGKPIARSDIALTKSDEFASKLALWWDMWQLLRNLRKEMTSRDHLYYVAGSNFRKIKEILNKIEVNQ